MSSAALAELIDYGATHELESMLIVRHGAIVAEAYYAPFRAGVKHRMNSATKSVIGTLVAIALKEGRLSSTDQRAVDFFADQTIANLDDRKRAITIQNLLDMTSGLSWTERLGDGRPQSMIAMERSADWAQFVLDQPMAAGPGTTFNYSSGNPHLLSAILTKATGESALDYARERLFGPLGISDVFWRQDPQGVSVGGFGLFLQPRDMAKLGYLWLRHGVWDGAEIIPQAWIDRVRHATIPMGIANLRYGNLFWVDPDSGVFYANGFHGQRIFVAPALDVVAVATATGFSASGSALIGMIADAVKSDGPLPPDVASQSLLASRIREAATEKPLPVGQTPTSPRRSPARSFVSPTTPCGSNSLTLTLDGPNPSYAYAFKPTRPNSPLNGSRDLSASTASIGPDRRGLKERSRPQRAAGASTGPSWSNSRISAATTCEGRSYPSRAKASIWSSCRKTAPASNSMAKPRTDPPRALAVRSGGRAHNRSA